MELRVRFARPRSSPLALLAPSRTHEFLRTPAFETVPAICPELPHAAYRCQMRGLSVGGRGDRGPELPALSIRWQNVGPEPRKELRARGGLRTPRFRTPFAREGAAAHANLLTLLVTEHYCLAT